MAASSSVPASKRIDLLADSKVQALQKETEKIISRISDSIVSVDNEWRYTFLNDAALLDHPQGNIGTLGKVIWEVHPKMHGTLFWDKYHEAKNSGKPLDFESFYSPLSSWFSVKVYPGADGLTIFYNNISGRKKLDDQIEKKRREDQIQTEHFADSLINSLPGIFYLYDQDGRFTRWNKNFETISGYNGEEISHMHPLDFYDGDEKKLMKRKIEKIFKDGDEEITAHFYTKDKKKIPYYFNGHKISINGNDYLIGVGIDITERTRVEQELMAYTMEIKKLTAHLEQVREEERTRIAREIHDELGQQLTGLKMDASWLSKKIGRDEKSLHEKLASMISLMDHTVKTIRRISSDLRPGILDDLGLVAALEWQSNEFEKRTETRCIFKSQIENLNIDRHLATGVFRIYQEALTNVMRHAKATLVEASLVSTKTHIVLTIEDNGQGFDTSTTKMKESLGLIGMRERASMLGITLNIVSGIGTGTSVILRIPLTLNTSVI